MGDKEERSGLLRKKTDTFTGTEQINGCRMDWEVHIQTSFLFRRIRQEVVYVRIKKDGIVTEEIKDKTRYIVKPDMEDEETHICFAYIIQKATKKAMEAL